MDEIFLHLGSNIGDKRSNLKMAKILIGTFLGTIDEVSSIYQTAAWGKEDQDDFYNQVLKITSDVSPYEMLQTIQRIEQFLGRVRHEKWSSRIIDIDILFYKNLILDKSDLQIPHPRIQLRNFVLVPLAEIAQDFLHPQYHKSIKQLLSECSDTLVCEKI